MSKQRYAIAVIVLIAIVAVFNYAIKMDPTQLAARGVGRDAHEHHDEEPEEQAEQMAPPDSIGPEDAPVLLEVFYQSDNECMMEFEPLAAKIGEQYAPHVRVEFKPTHVPENQERSDKLELGCASGIAINGEVVKAVPGAGRFGMVSFRGPPMQKGWNESMLRKVIDHELEGKDIHFTPPPDEEERPAAEEHHHEH